MIFFICKLVVYQLHLRNWELHTQDYQARAEMILARANLILHISIFTAIVSSMKNRLIML